MQGTEVAIIGSACVSTKDQSLDDQLDSLKAAGAERVEVPRMRGAKLRSLPEIANLFCASIKTIRCTWYEKRKPGAVAPGFDVVLCQAC